MSEADKNVRRYFQITLLLNKNLLLTIGIMYILF